MATSHNSGGNQGFFTLVFFDKMKKSLLRKPATADNKKAKGKNYGPDLSRLQLLSERF